MSSSRTASRARIVTTSRPAPNPTAASATSPCRICRWCQAAWRMPARAPKAETGAAPAGLRLAAWMAACWKTSRSAMSRWIRSASRFSSSSGIAAVSPPVKKRKSPSSSPATFQYPMSPRGGPDRAADTSWACPRSGCGASASRIAIWSSKGEGTMPSPNRAWSPSAIPIPPAMPLACYPPMPSF